MKTNIIFRAAILSFLLLVSASSFSQYAHTGDVFTPALGKSAESPEVSELIANYHMEKANDAHYLSQEGVELVLKDGLLNEVRLYQSSPVYGNFRAVLPHELKFGMSSSEVKALLGKPKVAYNSSGYSEFEKNGKIVSCWVEGGRLTQVSVSLK